MGTGVKGIALRALLGAVECRYKTVGEAARVLGLPIEPERQIWTRELVLAEIRRLEGASSKGKLRPVDLKRLDPKLYKAAYRRFGWVEKALQAAREG